MAARYKILISLLMVSFILGMAISDVYAKRGYLPKKVIMYNEIKSMPKGPETSAALAVLVKKDKSGFLGSKPVEELAVIYLSEGNVDGLYTLLKPLKKTKCLNYRLMMDISEMLVTERHDLDQAIEIMTYTEYLVLLDRMKPPVGTISYTWQEETEQIVAEIRRHNAKLYRMEGQFDAARANMYQSLSRDPNSEDYEFIGELMLLDKEYQAAMGAFMSSYFLGENELAVRFFRGAYDSLKWAPAYYDKYFSEFYKLHLEETALDIQSWGENGVAVDLESLPVSDLSNQFGSVLIFWNDDINEIEAKALYRVQNSLMAKGIPYRFVYFGDKLEETENRITRKGIYFGDQFIGDNLVQQMYQVAAFPTVLALDDQNRFLFRIEGENISMDRLFDKLWGDYLEKEHADLIMSQIIPTSMNE